MKDRLKWIWEYELPKWTEKFQMKIIWMLPRRFVFLSAIRVMAHASRVYSDKETGEISIIDILKAWDKYD